MKPVRDPCAYVSYYFGAYFQFEGEIGEILQKNFNELSETAQFEGCISFVYNKIFKWHT